MLESLKRKRGAHKLEHPLVLAILVMVAVVAGVLIAKGGFKIAVMIVAMLPVLIFLNRVFNNPPVGIYTLLVFAFIAIGLTRYIQNVPLGLSIDGFLVITIIGFFFKYFNIKIDFQQINRDIVYLLFFWFLYILIQLGNPQALSRTAWFYAMRGVALYPLLLVPISFFVFNRLRYMMGFLYLWGVFTILATLVGLKQEYIGLDYAEQYWIDTIGGVTHIILGKLRIFSFFSDAGQFGAAQAAAGVVGILVASSIKGIRNKVFFIIMGVMGIWGMFLSGTRGAMIVPMIGGAVYIVLRKNIRVMIIGGFFMAVIYVFFAYTYIGESNYNIARMRTAFRPSTDASYQVRLENRAILKDYLSDKPIGGGVGSAGNWGQRFSPQGFLAQVATDSWYVQIWAETGIIGLFIHVFILSYIIIKGFYLILFRVRNPELAGILGALHAGFAGIMGASYGNGVLGQIPTGPIVYLSWIFVFMALQLDREYDYLKENDITPTSLFTKT
ncbi:MAG: O-antigen ligase domain-containing protein [Marinilabiliales bacterium]|nr:MAG: O-antigen ligase domain-containing protein [Marinilabiliales bacterium]